MLSVSGAELKRFCGGIDNFSPQLLLILRLVWPARWIIIEELVEDVV